MAKTTIDIEIQTNVSGESVKDLRQQFNEVEDALFEMAGAGKQNTEEFRKLQKEAAKIKERVDDLNESIDMLKPEAKFQAIANLGAGVASGFAAAQGAAQLFGQENEALDKSLAKVQAAMALAQGVQGLAGMGDSLRVVGAMLKSTTIGTKLATAAQWLWNTAIMANPIMAIITAIGALVTAIIILTRTMNDEDEAQKEVIKNREKELELMQEADKAMQKEADFRKNLAAAQGKSAKEQLALNEELSKQRIKQIDNEIQTAKKLILERLARAKNADEEEKDELYKANSETLKLMKSLADERLSIQRNLQIESTKLETDTNKAAADKAKEKQQKDKENADKKRQKDLEDAEKWRQEQAKFIQYEIDALNNKFGEEEQIIAEQQLATKIALGIATPEEIDAWDAMRLQKQKEYNAEVDAELKRLKEIEDKKRKDDEEKEKLALEIKKRNNEFAVKATLESLQVIQSLTDAFAGKSIESQKKAFNVKKAASLAQTTIETYLAAQSAFASQIIPGDPTSPVRGAIAAGLAIASGLARVAVIAKTKFEGGGGGASGGGGGGNLGTFSQGGGGGQPPQGLTAQNTVTQLNPDGTVAGQGNREAAPMKAYVVESESRAVTERVNKLSNNSKIG
jgi:hypothetical protein